MHNNWQAVVSNLRKLWVKWESMSRIPVWEGAYAGISDKFFKSVIQINILFVLEIWMVTPALVIHWGECQNRVSHWLTDNKPWRRPGRIWIYPP